MGRPLKSKFFDPIAVESGLAGAASAIFVAGLSIAPGSGSNLFLASSSNTMPTISGVGYATATASVVFSAPDLAGGTTITGTPVVATTGNGTIQAVTITNVGAGYTATPTITFLGANTSPASGTILGGQMVDLLTANVIAISAYIPVANGGTSAIAGDIVAQKGSHRYKVKTNQGTGVCTLVAAAPAAGQMTITATDSAAGTYYVTKLMDRKCRLTQNTGTQFATGAIVKWVLAPGSAIANDTVVISSN